MCPPLSTFLGSTTDIIVTHQYNRIDQLIPRQCDVYWAVRSSSSMIQSLRGLMRTSCRLGFRSIAPRQDLSWWNRRKTAPYRRTKPMTCNACGRFFWLSIRNKRKSAFRRWNFAGIVKTPVTFLSMTIGYNRTSKPCLLDTCKERSLNWLQRVHSFFIYNINDLI